MIWIVSKFSEIEKQQVPLKYFWSFTIFFGEMSQIWVKRILSSHKKTEQKFWPKRKTSQPIFWTFLKNFLSQNLVLTCNISRLWRKWTLFLNECKKCYDQEKTQKFGCDVLRFGQNFCSVFYGMTKKIRFTHIWDISTKKFCKRSKKF